MDRRSGRPPDDLPGEQVHHASEVEQTLPRADIGDIRHSNSIGAANVKVPLYQIGNECGWFARRIMACMACPVSVERTDFVDSHETRDAMLAACLTGFPNVEEYPR